MYIYIYVYQISAFRILLPDYYYLLSTAQYTHILMEILTRRGKRKFLNTMKFDGLDPRRIHERRRCKKAVVKNIKVR